LPFDIEEVVPTEVAPPIELEIVPLAVMERRLIEAALRRTNNDVPRAAALLEVNPSTIYRKLQAWRAEAAQS
jgi:two-component system repressor protein LuxO